MPSRTNHPTGYRSCWFPGDMMSYSFYDLYSHELKKGELLSQILPYEFEHITKKCGMCVILISVSHLGFMGSKVQWNTTGPDKYDGYKRPSICWRSLLRSLFSTILCFSVSNGSGPSLRVRVRVGTEPEPDWRSRLSINPNCRFGYGSIDISLPVRIGRVPSGL